MIVRSLSKHPVHTLKQTFTFLISLVQIMPFSLFQEKNHKLRHCRARHCSIPFFAW